MAEPRTRGVTILLHRQVLVTQEPTEKDHQFIAQVYQWTSEWIKDGKPVSNQGMY